MALLSDRTIASLQAIEVEGLENTAVGGTTWIPKIVTGDGVTTDRVVTNGTAITGFYVEQRRTTGASRTAAGAVVPEAYWVGVATEDEPTQGAVIQSQADSTYQFRVVGLDQWDVWPTYILEPITT